MSNPYVHAPLPYVVVLRVSVTPDSKPERIEWRGTAYSLMEALLQASTEATGIVPDSAAKYVVESVRPDLDGYGKPDSPQPTPPASPREQP